MEEFMTEISEKPEFEPKEMKKDLRRMGWGLILYMVLLYLVVAIDAACKVIAAAMQSPTGVLTAQEEEALTLAMSESGLSMMAGVGVGLLVLWLLLGGRVKLKECFREKAPMSPRLFVQYLSVFMAVQLIFSWFAGLLELVLNLFGYSAMASIEAASGGSSTVSMFIYASFAAPVAEELVYRGFVQGSLRKYGKMPAIVVSALLFGIMHGNLPQAVFAFFVGLVLGVVAEEYSLKWAIAIHMINNCVFAELTGLLGKFYGENLENLLSGIIIYGFFIAGSMVLGKNMQKIEEYREEHRVDKKIYLCALTTLPILLFIAVNFLIGLAGIETI